MSEYLEFGKALALQAGEIMQSERQGHLRIQQKPDKTLVTHVDLAIQDFVIDAIQHNFPGHTIIGEERSYGPKDAPHIWRIDPLDGTGEYIEGEDSSALTYGFGLAKQYEGALEIGIFFNPSKEELYTAVRSLGAFLNGKRMQVGRQQFSPGVAYDYCHWEGAQPDPRILENILGPPLNHYSAIYQSCMVALGKSAFSVFPGNTAHDVAPGAILVAEAGGCVSDLRGDTHDWRSEIHGAIFSNNISHQQILTAIGS